MQVADIPGFIRNLYHLILKRDPGEAELSLWVIRCEEGTLVPEALLEIFRNSQEYKAMNRIRQFAPPGHYYSPIVDPDTVEPYYSRSLSAGLKCLDHINCNILAMVQLVGKHADIMRNHVFPRTASRRFYSENGFFPDGDAISLRLMILEHRPKQIIEIGSGFSTAVMLDSFDDFSLKVKLTCIEPNPERLLDLLKPEDNAALEIKQCLAQDLASSDLVSLDRGDILFIDSTHVVKTGSDVCHQLFQLLPSLRSGVIIHFHDCAYPFEYPRNWIFGSTHSWNEIYAIRLFLMYNSSFEIVFWASLLNKENQLVLVEIQSDLKDVIYTSIYLRKI